MLNKVFSQLTEAKRFRKFDIIIRRNTENLLNAEQVISLLNEVLPDYQCNIVVHPAERENCEALVDDDNILHIFIPEK